MDVSCDKYDIAIVGAGPVGLLLATCLARWGYKIKIIDNRETPTLTGRADGIQPRSLDLLRNMGLKRQIMAHHPARVYRVAFWDPLPKRQGIHRTGKRATCPKFIDTRYPFTLALHQGLIEKVLIEDMMKNGVFIQRPWTITGFFHDDQDKSYPIVVSLKHVQKEQTETIRARYLFSGEGSKSFIRDRLGVQLHHKDPISDVWGVIDGIVRTDFPDIKMKCTIHSDSGSIMVIPRENNLVRLYIQIATSTDDDFDPRKKASPEEVQASARKIFKPYYIEWDKVEWYSVYPIGQGIAEKYTIDHRVFMGGDCCHTHSPKAGQGMNTAFHDALNLAWKIHLVEAGFCARSVLHTYESERKRIAEDLLEFDAKYAKLFSQRTPTAGEVSAASDDQSGQEANEFVKIFKSSQEFVSGYGIAYEPNAFNWTPSHPARSGLFNPKSTKLQPGRVMPPADVTRVIDANIVHLEQEIPLNGSFRIFLFAGAPLATRQALADFAINLQRKGSFYRTFEREDKTQVSYHERHNPHSHFFSICTIFAAPRDNVEITSLLPPLLARYSHHIYADDAWSERAPEAKVPAHAKVGLDQKRGGVIVVRPDGHVGCVVGLTEGSGTVDALNNYFGAFVAKAIGETHALAHL